ncbi:MAG: YihY/virulence factor BrkB family protein [Candidatus Nanohaloarchaea archaeon]|nr:YihY/virulence factor BrkB family protein [Candidatus Nanohaloarchaea archaeon]
MYQQDRHVGMQRLVRAARTLLEALRVAREDKVDFMASGVTYYTFFSLAPLALILFVTASVFGGEALAAGILVAVTGILPEVGRGVVTAMFRTNLGQSSIVSILVLVWASLQLFRGFDIAFSEIYGEEHEETLVEELEDAVVALVALGTAVFLTAAAGTALAAVPAVPSVGIVWTVLTFIGLVAVFLPLYYVFTDVDIDGRGLLPGAVVAAAGWTLLQSGFSVYAARVGGSLYGIFGGLLLLILWMYIGNMLILFGAVVNYVLWQNR